MENPMATEWEYTIVYPVDAPFGKDSGCKPWMFLVGSGWLAKTMRWTWFRGIPNTRLGG